MPFSSEGSIHVETPADNIADAVVKFFTEHCTVNVEEVYRDAIFSQLWMTTRAVCMSTVPQIVQFGFTSLESSPMRYTLHTPRKCARFLEWAFDRQNVITLSPSSPLVKRAVNMQGVYLLCAAPKLLVFGNDVVWSEQD